MGKKKTAASSSEPAEETRAAGVEQPPKVRKAADAVRQAEAELQKARQLYQKLRQETTNRLKVVREKTVGDLIDGGLKLVRKHPGPSVTFGVVIGFFLGRIFRR